MDPDSRSQKWSCASKKIPDSFCLTIWEGVHRGNHCFERHTLQVSHRKWSIKHVGPYIAFDMPFTYSAIQNIIFFKNNNHFAELKRKCRTQWHAENGGSHRAKSIKKSLTKQKRSPGQPPPHPHPTPHLVGAPLHVFCVNKVCVQICVFLYWQVMFKDEFHKFSCIKKLNTMFIIWSFSLPYRRSPPKVWCMRTAIQCTLHICERYTEKRIKRRADRDIEWQAETLAGIDY